MLDCVGHETFVATCDRCAAVAPAIVGVRELAITRLMLQRWHLRRTQEGMTAICPTCRPTTFPGVPPVQPR